MCSHADSIAQELQAYMHVYVEHRTKKDWVDLVGNPRSCLQTMWKYSGFCVYKSWLLHRSSFAVIFWLSNLVAAPSSNLCGWGRQICLWFGMAAGKLGGVDTSHGG